MSRSVQRAKYMSCLLLNAYIKFISDWYFKAWWKQSGKQGRTDRRTDEHCHGIIRPFFPSGRIKIPHLQLCLSWIYNGNIFWMIYRHYNMNWELYQLCKRIIVWNSVKQWRSLILFATSINTETTSPTYWQSFYYRPPGKFWYTDC